MTDPRSRARCCSVRTSTRMARRRRVCRRSGSAATSCSRVRSSTRTPGLATAPASSTSAASRTRTATATTSAAGSSSSPRGASSPRALSSKISLMISALEALARLREGNARFASDVRDGDPNTTRARRRALAAGQEPFAIVLGCADSRVPAEIVFDQGVGDLFVIRVAGNIVASSQVDSVEFAAARFGTRLVVVLGHSQCGAIVATVEELQQPATSQSRNLRSIVARIRPCVEALMATELRHDSDALVRQAVRANILASANHLRHGSDVLERLVQGDELLVVGAEYSLETGIVEFFDGIKEEREDDTSRS